MGRLLIKLESLNLQEDEDCAEAYRIKKVGRGIPGLHPQGYLLNIEEAFNYLSAHLVGKTIQSVHSLGIDSFEVAFLDGSGWCVEAKARQESDYGCLHWIEHDLSQLDSDDGT